MALPKLSPAQRAEALQKAAAVRKERSALLAELKDGKVSLKDVLAREDTVTTRTPVERLLKSLPGIGAVRAGQLMEELEIPEGRRVAGLGPRQRERLAELFPASP
ncbi:integration host factor, actinobacterial type [Streptomyces sp. Wb2n-11]|uniref:integration host factor, actinobacterial type n=1 Tax=Streptomyces sp. Wb2n-11 TaxID=1030533 RepID=UPI000AA7A9AD|nr:integration host factor, actinobacterial type [Streptomyces sp. Wb2n-11]